MIPARIPGWAMAAGAAAAVAGLIYLWRRGAAGVGQDVGKGAVAVVDGVIGAVVETAGGIVGIPETDKTKCAAAKQAGNGWDVSLYCPAAEWAEWIATPAARQPAQQPAPGWEYQPVPETCIGGFCGPSFEDSANWWATDSALYWNGQRDYSAEILRPAIVPVAGLRG